MWYVEPIEVRMRGYCVCGKPRLVGEVRRRDEERIPVKVEKVTSLPVRDALRAVVRYYRQRSEDNAKSEEKEERGRSKEKVESKEKGRDTRRVVVVVGSVVSVLVVGDEWMACAECGRVWNAVLLAEEKVNSVDCIKATEVRKRVDAI